MYQGSLGEGIGKRANILRTESLGQKERVSVLWIFIDGLTT